MRTLAIGLAFAVAALTPVAAQAWWYYGYGYPYPYPYPYAYAYAYPYAYPTYAYPTYPYPPPPYPSPAATAPAAPAGTASEPHFRYRCDQPAGYYPQIASCPGGWHEEQARTQPARPAPAASSVTVTPLPSATHQ